MANAQLTYTGRHTNGVVVGSVLLEHGVPTECDAATAKALTDEQPDAFKIAAPAKTKEKAS